MFLAVMIINFFQISVKSLQKVLLSSKIIIIFRFVAENKLETMGYVEIISNFIPETHFCCYNTGAKSEQFFTLQAAKILLKSCGATCTFCLVFAAQHIAL